MSSWIPFSATPQRRKNCRSNFQILTQLGEIRIFEQGLQLATSHLGVELVGLEGGRIAGNMVADREKKPLRPGRRGR